MMGKGIACTARATFTTEVGDPIPPEVVLLAVGCGASMDRERSALLPTGISFGVSDGSTLTGRLVARRNASRLCDIHPLNRNRCRVTRRALYATYPVTTAAGTSTGNARLPNRLGERQHVQPLQRPTLDKFA